MAFPFCVYNITYPAAVRKCQGKMHSGKYKPIHHSKLKDPEALYHYMIVKSLLLGVPRPAHILIYPQVDNQEFCKVC